MRCYICNRRLEPSEVKQNKKTNEWEPCSSCRSEVSSSLTHFDRDDKLYELFELDEYDE